jgi:hypothetical protein
MPAHLAPVGWQHINLTGDYLWDSDRGLGPDGFRPLRATAKNFTRSPQPTFKGGHRKGGPGVELRPSAVHVSATGSRTYGAACGGKQHEGRSRRP